MQLQFLMEACSLTKTPSENLAQFTGSLSKTALLSLSFSQRVCPAQLQSLMGAHSLTKTPFQNLSKFGPVHRQFVPRRRPFNFLTKICPVQLQFLLGKRSATKNFSSNKILPSSPPLCSKTELLYQSFSAPVFDGRVFPYQNFIPKFGTVHRQFVPRRRSLNFLAKILPSAAVVFAGKALPHRQFVPRRHPFT